MYTYPDLAAVCGPLKLEDGQHDTLLNPISIIEVLSPSTRFHDRVEKFAHYRRIESLREYILIAQDRYLVEQHIHRDGAWVFTEHNEPDGILRIEIYGQVEWLPTGPVPWPTPG